MTQPDRNRTACPDSGLTRRGLLQLWGGALAYGLVRELAAPADILAAAAPMRIAVLSGSPRRGGNSAQLTDAFCAGARGRGHEVTRCDTGLEPVGPCRACYYCAGHEGRCLQRDAMDRWLPAVLAADMVVLVTPLYMFGPSAQLKAAMDRMMPRRKELLAHPVQSALMVTAGSTPDWNMDAVLSWYRILCRWLPWQDRGVVLARGVFAPDDIAATSFPDEARALGASI